MTPQQQRFLDGADCAAAGASLLARARGPRAADVRGYCRNVFVSRLGTELRSALDQAIADLTRAFEDVIRDGIQEGEFERCDARRLAAYFVASLEGGVLLAVHFHQPTYLAAVATALEDQARSGLRHGVPRIEVG